MVPSSGTNISSVLGLDSFNRKTITAMVIKDKISAAKTGNIAPYIVPPKIPASAGPRINPRLEDIAIFPKFLLLVVSDERSAR